MAASTPETNSDKQTGQFATNLHDDDVHTNDLSGEAAGVVRGVSRSVVRAPWIGRLPQVAPPKPIPMPRAIPKGMPKSLPKATPRPAIPRPPASGPLGGNIFGQQMPVRQVARVTDRISTGFDIYHSAMESSETSTTPPANPKTADSSKKVVVSSSRQWLGRIPHFFVTLARNTLLGMAVFESFGYIVNVFAPPVESEMTLPVQVEVLPEESSHEQVGDDAIAGGITAPLEAGDASVAVLKRRVTSNGEEGNRPAVLTGNMKGPDEYARASLLVHFGAGTLAGSIHGVGASIFEGGSASSASSFRRFLLANTVHHAVAHAMLFGSYEGTKRTILHVIRESSGMEEHDTGQSRAWPRFHSATDGQLEATKSNMNDNVDRAGHLVTFGLAGGLAGCIQHIVSYYAEARLALSQPTFRGWKQIPLPAMKPCLWAFPPSAIGFIAFEYGKTFLS